MNVNLNHDLLLTSKQGELYPTIIDLNSLSVDPETIFHREVEAMRDNPQN
jgi:hypothetical protein